MWKFSWTAVRRNLRLIRLRALRRAWRDCWDAVGPLLRQLPLFTRAPKLGKAWASERPALEVLEARVLLATTDLVPILPPSMPVLDSASVPVYRVIAPPEGGLTASLFTAGTEVTLPSGTTLSATTPFFAPEASESYSSTVTTTTEDFSSTLTISGHPIVDGSYYEEDFYFSYDTGSATGEAWYTFVATTTSTDTIFSLTLGRTDEASGSQIVASAPRGATGSITWTWHDSDLSSRSLSNNAELSSGVVTDFTWSDSGSASVTNSSSGSGSYAGTGVDLPPGFTEAVNGVQTGSEYTWMYSDFSASGDSSTGSGSSTATTGTSRVLSYEGSGTYEATATSGTVTENGVTSFSAQFVSNKELGGSGDWALLGGSGSGTQNVFAAWSYSGSGAYTDASAASGIAFFWPNSGSMSLTGSVTGTAYGSGEVIGTASGNWTADEDTAGNWSYSGSASTTSTWTTDSSYSGAGSYTVIGAVSGSGTITESGARHSEGSAVAYDVITASGVWDPTGGTGSASATGILSWSYSGSGTYTDSDAGSDISFFVPGSGSTTVTASVTGVAYASGSASGSLEASWTASRDTEGEWSASGSATTTTTHASYDVTVHASGKREGVGCPAKWA